MHVSTSILYIIHATGMMYQNRGSYRKMHENLCMCVHVWVHMHMCARVCVCVCASVA